MSFTFTKTQAALACALALGAYCATAGAQESNEHLIVTSSSGQPVMSGSGLCVYSGTAAPDTARVSFDTARPPEPTPDYNLRTGDRVIMMSNGKVGSPGSAPSWTAGCSS